jgi:methylated-DNA-[protein]-cysteine S-methyltransferase
MERFSYTYIDSPLGEIEIKFDEENLRHIFFRKETEEKKGEAEKVPVFVVQAIMQLNDFFAGELSEFNLRLDLKGTDFQEKVWNELRNIPYGKTISYLQLAKKLGDVKNIRAAASANGKNPFAIVIPCHRVIGTDGSLTGYAGGLWRKQWLLEHEAKKVGTYNKLF